MRPRILLVQNPSWVLTFLAIILKPVFQYCLVVDAHNAGVLPSHRGHEHIGFMLPFFHRNADLTIVTNESCAQIVQRHGGRTEIVPDPLPELHPGKSERNRKGDFVVVFVCTFACDEPFAEVLVAARQLPDEVIILITGDSGRCPAALREHAPGNVRFTGYLPEDEYIGTLANADLIMDLTTREDCLVCGAYEAVALGVPMVLSDTAINREFFHSGAIYVRNEARAIASALREAHCEVNRLRGEVQELAVDLRRLVQDRIKRLRSAISRCCCDGTHELRR